MHLGVDFDNTLVSLDHLFQDRAARRGWVTCSTTLNKNQVRTGVRALADGEACWQSLQAEVYGPAMAEARIMEGAESFLIKCRRQGVRISIVSHKTQMALQEAAWQWLEMQGFFSPPEAVLSREGVYFESSRLEKLRRIAALGLDCFVDDLPEVLTDADFPATVPRIWFNPEGLLSLEGVLSFSSWREIEGHVFP